MGSEVGKLVSDKNKFDEDKFFSEYASKAQSYLNRDTFSGTPLTGDMLASAARQAYQQTGKIVPLNLALSQAQFESSMGRKGRAPQTNPYNVGEFDEETKQTFSDTQSGVNAYYNLMAKDYLRDKTPEQLLNNFVNYRGDRYASNKQYEKQLREQSDYINKFVNVAPQVQPTSVSGLSSFGQAFSDAKASGKKTFEFGNKLYKVEMK